MKRAIFIFISAAAFCLAAYLAIWVFAPWYENNFAKSEHDLSMAYLWFLGVLLISTLVGGFVGNGMYRRNLTNRYSGRAKARH